MILKNGMILMTAILFGSIILFVVLGLSPVFKQTTSIMAIVPATENNHSVVFRVCAEETIMRSPEVKISSDIEEKNIRLSQEIQPNTCRQTASTIKASDPSTINLKKVDKTDLNKMVTEAENKVLKIRSEISDKNAELEKIVATIPEDRPAQITINQKVNTITLELVQLRKELQEAKNDYDRVLALLKG